MIEAHDLTRKFGDFTAVAGVSLALQEGEIVGILGPNGAGKTTTIRMLTGFLPPSSGRVTLGGRDLFGATPDSVAVRRELGYLPESVALYPEMRVEEYLSYRARLEGMDRTATRRRLGEVLDRCLLTEVRRQVIGTLSKGYRQRVGLAGAILHDPKVLVLDEPTVGLDPKQIVAIRELIRELGRKHTLLLSTHILPEVELLCGRVLIFDRGRIVAEGSPDELRERLHGQVAVTVEFESAAEDMGEALGRVTGVQAVRREAERAARFTLDCAPGADPRAALFRLAVERSWTLVELVAARASLEDIFVRLVTSDRRDAEPAAGESPLAGEAA
ncbi:MAG: ATP-binding cassette domain-containing protein [Thermoanaerobaculia bacterium]|nr:ATP-binding cassette domain-containing protein [Thermoanaerobaculia bacterium]MBP9825360.1 ATP-binding cassette domain-containing protein [Thermoanaerobaculia bacterium]